MTNLHDYIHNRVHAAAWRGVTPITLQTAVQRATTQDKINLVNALKNHNEGMAGKMLLTMLNDFLAARIASRVAALEAQAAISDTDLDTA